MSKDTFDYLLDLFDDSNNEEDTNHIVEVLKIVGKDIDINKIILNIQNNRVKE